MAKRRTNRPGQMQRTIDAISANSMIDSDMRSPHDSKSHSRGVRHVLQRIDEANLLPSELSQVMGAIYPDDDELTLAWSESDDPNVRIALLNSDRHVSDAILSGITYMEHPEVAKARSQRDATRMMPSAGF